MESIEGGNQSLLFYFKGDSPTMEKLSITISNQLEKKQTMREDCKKDSLSHVAQDLSKDVFSFLLLLCCIEVGKVAYLCKSFTSLTQGSRLAVRLHRKNRRVTNYSTFQTGAVGANVGLALRADLNVERTAVDVVGTEMHVHLVGPGSLRLVSAVVEMRSGLFDMTVHWSATC